MKEIFKKSGRLFGYLVCAGIMCCFTYLSFNVIFNAVFTEKTGYDVYGYTESAENREYLYTFTYSDGKDENAEDLKWSEYEDKGYTLDKISKRSEISDGANTALIIICQLFCIIITATFVIDVLLPLGSKDNNMVRIKAKPEDKLKGFKIALLSSAPALALFAALVICRFAKPDMPSSFYMILNGTYWPVLSAVLKGTVAVGDIKLWQLTVMLLLQLIVPVVGFFAYFVGYKDYAVLSKLLYKKNKKG